MGQARGYKSRLVLDFETAFKTDPSTPAGHIMPFNSYSVQGSRNKESANTIRGRRDPVAPFDGNESVDGPLVVPVDVRNIGLWLKALLGAPDSTDNGDGTYDHVYSISDSQPSMVLETRLSDNTSVIKYIKHNGCKLNSLEISAGGDGELVANLNIMGAAEALGDSAYDSDPTELSFQRFRNFQATLKEGGSALTGTATNMTLNVAANLDGDQYTIGDNGTRGDISEGLMGLSGSIDALFKDTSAAMLQKAIDSTETSLELAFEDSNGNSLTFTLPELQFAQQGPTVDGPQGVRISLPFQAYYDDAAEGTGLQVTLVNDQVSY